MNIDIRRINYTDFTEIKVEDGNTKIDLGFHSRAEALTLSEVFAEAAEELKAFGEG